MRLCHLHLAMTSESALLMAADQTPLLWCFTRQREYIVRR